MRLENDYIYNMNKFISFSIAALALVATTSCEGIFGEIDETTTYYDFGTLTGAYPNYTFYADHGGVVKFNSSSVAEYTNGKGFGSTKRAWFCFQYDEANRTIATNEYGDEEATVTLASIVEGYALRTSVAIDSVSAAAANINVPDSMFAILGYGGLWYSNGYLNIESNGQLSGTVDGAFEPTVTLVYNNETMTDNHVEFNYCYNRHSEKTATVYSNGSLLTSFNIQDVITKVPGNNDTIFVKLKAEGMSDCYFNLLRPKGFRGN